MNYTEKQGLPSNEIRTIEKMDNGEIWVATHGGGIITIKQDKFNIIDESTGLSSNLVMSLKQDRKGRVWVGTESGLNLLTANTHFDGYQIFKYNKSDGLRGLDFYTNSVFLSSDNIMWWGTGKGITFLNLDGFRLHAAPSDIVIEALQIKQQYYDFNSIKDSLTSSDQYEGIMFDSVVPYYNRPEMLTIPYDKRYVTFYFAAKDEPNKQNIKYIFRLFPLEEEWSLPTEENKADYRGIPPGEYQFEVKAITSNGMRSKKAVQKIYITYPWWMNPWMYLLYVIVFLGVLGLLHRWRTSVLKRRQYELEQLVQTRTVEIQEKNEELNVLLEQITDQRNEIEAQRDTVMNQKDQLQQVNTSISQSIDYAKRIQSSLMPDYYEFREIFSESFMIFKPRNIVSGDFFWWAEEGNRIISVVADCTGHGVPGAFMSVLGITFLREIVHKEHCFEPHEILNRLREEIIIALSQKNVPGEIRDGMEMTVLLVDKNSNTVSFSGANNSIYHNKDGVLTELKGQKFPVAAYPDMKPFEKTAVEFNPGDAFYMFSDGYHDQFSETSGKKIKKSRFFSLIQDGVEKKMEKQKEALVDFLSDWQGTFEQIDDILVLGFKIPEEF